MYSGVPHTRCCVPFPLWLRAGRALLSEGTMGSGWGSGRAWTEGLASGRRVPGRSPARCCFCVGGILASASFPRIWRGWGKRILVVPAPLCCVSRTRTGESWPVPRKPAASSSTWAAGQSGAHGRLDVLGLQGVLWRFRGKGHLPLETARSGLQMGPISRRDDI